MATISIVVLELENNTKILFKDLQDDMEASQLVPALVNYFKLSPQKDSPYRLARVKNSRVLKERDTLHRIGSAANETFLLGTEEQIENVVEGLLRRPSIIEVIVGLMAGIFFIAFNFPVGLTKLGNALGWSWIRDLGAFAKSVLTNLFGASASMRQNESFNNLCSGLIIVLLLYLGALALLSIRHRRFDFVGSGFLFLIVGTAFIHLVAWALYIVIIVVAFVFRIVGFLFSLLGSLFHLVFNGIAGLFRNSNAWWLFAIVLFIISIFLAVKYRGAFFKAALWVLGTCGAFALAGGLLYLLGKLIQYISPFLHPIFAFIGLILGVIIRFFLIGLLVGGIIYWLGSLLVSQFKGAWEAGNGRRGIIIGALAIGTSLALLLLESNLYNLALRFPSVVTDFVAGNIHQVNPIFDAVMALLVVGVSIIGVLRNLSKLQKEPRVRDFQIAMATTAPLVIVGVVLIAIQTRSES